MRIQLKLIFTMYLDFICEFVCIYMQIPRVQKKVLGAQELGLQAAMEHLMWMLGTKLTSSARTANTLNH